MGRIREAFEGYWNGEVSPDERPPFVPMLALEEVTDRVAFVSSFANVTAIRTDEGLVLVDVGSFLMSTQVFAALREWSDARVDHVVYTHGHVDHVFGVDRYEAEASDKGWVPPRVIAHENVPARFERYKRSAGWNACINARQFQSAVSWPTNYRYPDETFRDHHVLEVGGERFELHHARGETDDATWVYVPSRKVICAGDMFIWATPNAGNPQKVQRYPREWAQALRTMQALGAEVLCPGHGPPIWGKERVERALSETASLLESLHDQTLEMMNAGKTLDEIVHSVKAPAHLLERPYLRPLYDEPEFVVRNVHRLYGGWWDGNPAHLLPAPERALATELASLAGGASKLAERAIALLDQGDLALAAHLAETARAAAPDDPKIADTHARVFDARATAASSLMARGVFRAASDASRKRAGS